MVFDIFLVIYFAKKNRIEIFNNYCQLVILNKNQIIFSNFFCMIFIPFVAVVAITLTFLGAS